MGKRGNDNSQLSKEDYEAQLADSSDVPKGPFAKASADVMKSRRVIKARKFGVKKSPTPSAPVGNSVFSGVSLAAGTGTPSAGSSNPFGGFSFGSSSSSSAPASKPAFPSFATPAAAPASAKPTVATTKSGDDESDKDKLLIQCARAFRKHVDTHGLQPRALRQFIATYHSISQSKSDAKPAGTPAVAAAASKPAITASWDSSRSLFGGKSPTAAASPAPLFGASSSAAAAGGFSFSLPTKAAPAASPSGFSFNPAKPATSSASVPAFSFSTTPAPSVKAAAEATATETSTKASDGDNAEEAEEETKGAQENEENSDYTVLYKTRTKILRVKTRNYIKGDLKIEQHKETKKNRLVVRESTVGRVQMNVAITKGMPLSKDISESKKNGQTVKTPIVIISAVFDEASTGPEAFKIITKMQEHENLFGELKKLV